MSRSEKRALALTFDETFDLPSLRPCLRKAGYSVFWDLEMKAAVSLRVLQRVLADAREVFVGFLAFLIEYV